MKSADNASPRILRFGVFEVDLKARELRKRGLRVKLQQKPFQILELLLERPGELVTRKEVAERLWPGVHVIYDRSMNTAVNGLRRALNDSPRNPRFLETRPGLGYRFVASVEKVDRLPSTHEMATAIDSLAILPFSNSAGDPAVDYLADGIPERIIVTLSAIDDLRVIARSTAFRYRGREIDPSAIGKDLNVRAVLTGRVSVRGADVSVSAELMDVSTGWRLWGEEYDGPLADIASIEKDLSTKIAAKLRLRLNRQQKSRIAAPATSNFEAYLDYLKGRYFSDKMTEDALRKSVAYFESAIAGDPNYAAAYAGLADTYCLFAMLDILSAREALGKSQELALSAVRMDTNLAEAHTSLAGVKKLYEWDWSGAESEYQRALELNSNDASAHHGYAALLSLLGRSDDAITEIERALELDPLSLVINNEVAWHRYMAHDYEGALQQAWRTLALEPRFAPAQHTLGLANEQLGSVEDAIVEFGNACACSGDHPGAVAALAHAHALAGQIDQARALLHELEDRSHRRHVSSYWISLVYVGLGDNDGAFRWLERAVAERDIWIPWVQVEPRFDPLRAEARFHHLLRRIHPNNERTGAGALVTH